MTQPDAELQNRIRFAHQARRAKERLLEDIRHALTDIGVIEEGDPYSHADLADVIRQLDDELNQGEKRSEALAAIDRVQAVAREWEFMSGRHEARRELLAALDSPAKER